VHAKKLELSIASLRQSCRRLQVTAWRHGGSVGQVYGDIARQAGSPERPSAPLSIGRYRAASIRSLSVAPHWDAQQQQPSPEGVVLESPPGWRNTIVAPQTVPA